MSNWFKRAGITMGAAALAATLLVPSSAQADLKTEGPAGMLLWLDASDPATLFQDAGMNTPALDGDPVGGWMDKSGNGYHATALPNARPDRNDTAMMGVPGVDQTIMPALRFMASEADGMAIDPNLTLTDDYTVFIVNQYHSAARGRTLQGLDSNWLHGLWAGNVASFADGWVSDNAGALIGFAYVADTTNSQSGDATFFVNGEDRLLDAGPAGVPGRLGIASVGQFPLEVSDADVAEIVIYDRVLNAAELGQVRDTLYDKYGAGPEPPLPPDGLWDSYFECVGGGCVSKSAGPFTGGDPGEGLNMEGDFLYAVNVLGPGDFLVGDALFTDDAVDGFTVVAQHEILEWNTPDYGTSDDDNGMETIIQSIRWSNQNDAIISVDVTLENLDPSQTYELQLLFGEQCCDRGFDIVVDGELEFDDFNVGRIQGGIANGAQGVVATMEVNHSSDTLEIFLGPPAFRFGDGNATLSGVTLKLAGDVVVPGINGGGQTFFEDFDSLGVKKGRMPREWSAVTVDGDSRRIDSLGLTDGPLNFPEDMSVEGVVNVGGNAQRFSTEDPSRVATWDYDSDGNSVFGPEDVIADGATDRALGVTRVNSSDEGKLVATLEILDNDLRAFVFDWDLEVWGGDPESLYRGTDGAGFHTEVTIGGQSYYDETKTLLPGDLFDTDLDGPNPFRGEPTLIDGNVHSIREITSGFQEVSGSDGAVGNKVQLSFDANRGAADEGWIQAVDNVRFRAVAPGDVDANGSVDPLDIVELLKGGQFGKGVNGVTWQQGDFNGDDKFDPLDLVAVLTSLNGQFPKTYASELGDPGDGTPDVIVDYTTGEVTVDFAGHTSSSVIIDSAAGVFNGDAPAWDTMGEFRTASAAQLSNTMFNGTESGVDSLGNLVKAEFMNPDFDFNADLTVKILVATPDGPVTVDGHVIVVPEPSSWMLLGLGSLAVLAITRRRQAS